ncbi:MEKHLA domain-containing protein [Uliginosibacterium sediminicola]|uniref:MEKHLA domain-containing protein n=1 Tax=Uliginosibacterium sediminicola TaxID=2024550 RepID=A0ABU9YZT5_9RHOO
MSHTPLTQTSWLRIILSSHEQLLGTPLVPAGLDENAALHWLDQEADFCVLAHEASADPRFVYANAATLRCFGYSADEFIGLPSRLSAEAPNREERDALLQRVQGDGFASGYRGLRIAKDGRRFWIEDVTVWNLLDAAGARIGQAATYRRITPA